MSFLDSIKNLVNKKDKEEQSDLSILDELKGEIDLTPNKETNITETAPVSNNFINNSQQNPLNSFNQDFNKVTNTLDTDNLSLTSSNFQAPSSPSPPPLINNSTQPFNLNSQNNLLTFARGNEQINNLDNNFGNIRKINGNDDLEYLKLKLEVIESKLEKIENKLEIIYSILAYKYK
jgi:hypothetical protein